MRWIMWILAAVLTAAVCYLRYKKGGFMGVLLAIAVIAAAVYGGVGLLLYLFQPAMVYQPSRTYDNTPADAGLVYESISLNTSDGQRLAGWFIPAGHNANECWTILFCHGNAGNISHRLDTLKLFHQLGLAVLIVDYRGYGQSTGKPTEKGTLQDIRAGWDWLIKKGIPARRIILFGRSLGGCIAALTAKDVNPAGLVLESTFTSIPDIGSHYYPWLPVRLFSRFRYDTLTAVRQLHCPILVIHSPDDEIVPFRFGKTIYDAANEPKWFGMLKGSHNEGFIENIDLYRHIWINWLTNLDTVNR
ncbi:MAG TPA: alpha/beta hydrolase [Anaerohalosphaeraceae bacterium]|nr:alpha/beta hydrolase [Anaerohalosphaeraceae bacterium]HOL30550.1 alpha/beta hydrolase [Anaerohalosphaeraceae bacterium]HOM75198.1 alpha/beta hydrolase [Anaerohalosphaeraceae bacterium]HPC64008.1 alpha/beta hydrolase [Anaerohalosphaeraceae bacterium]HPO70453.1 alpha/beta hydrolase [Anaerohalosphaeraceae bacterium]